MSCLIKKAEALKMLEERTGRKFSKGIFSEHFRRGRIWAAGGTVFASDVEKFIAARQARIDEPAERKIERRLHLLLGDLCKRDTTMQNLLKLVADKPEVAKKINGARGGLSWAVGGLLEALRALAGATEAADPTDATDQESKTVGDGPRTTDKGQPHVE